MIKRLIFQAMLLLAYELLVVLGLVSAVRWLSIQQAPPLARALVFLGGMALFLPPLLAVTLVPYRAPRWLAAVQAQGSPAAARVLKNEHLGDFWRPQDMPRYVTLAVQVQPDGGQAFAARLTCRLEQAQSLPPGTALAVRFDPQHPQQVALAQDGQGSH